MDENVWIGGCLFQSPTRRACRLATRHLTSVFPLLLSHRDFKDSVCRMPPEPLTSEPDSRFLNIPTTPYVLPGGPHSQSVPVFVFVCVCVSASLASEVCLRASLLSLLHCCADGTLLETGLERFQPPELLVDPCPSFFAASSKVQETSKSSFLMDSQLSPLSPGALPGEGDVVGSRVYDNCVQLCVE